MTLVRKFEIGSTEELKELLQRKDAINTVNAVEKAGKGEELMDLLYDVVPDGDIDGIDDMLAWDDKWIFETLDM